MKRSLLLPEEIGKLSSPDRLAIMRGLDPMIVRLPDISTMQGNKWLGLGDKEHNKKIQLERNTCESLKALGIEKKEINLSVWDFLKNINKITMKNYLMMP
ncbi:hypothetical protein AZF37_07260 [endosymbiont 'TC1' of Trimyema compressum]|nr:hypothetical protein AZF37_07260 [endosymbiont 'TC1' of Trimyema compressum]